MAPHTTQLVQPSTSTASPSSPVLPDTTPAADVRSWINGLPLGQTPIDQTVSVATLGTSGWASRTPETSGGHPPVAPWMSAVPSSRRRAPVEVWIVSIALAAVGALLLYPVVGGLPSLLREAFAHDGLTRALGTLGLQVVMLLLACALALLALAAGLLRGSKAAQVLTCYVVGVTALAEIVSAAQTGDGAVPPPTGVVVGTVLCAALAVALLCAREAVRRHFAAGPYPLGVTYATIVNVYLGAVLLIDGVLFELAGVAGQKYVWLGLGLAVAGFGLLATDRHLRAGRRGARAIVTACYLLSIVAVCVSASSTHTWASPASLLPLGVVGSAAAWLLFTPTSQAHFQRPGDPAAVAPLLVAAMTVLSLGALAGAVVGFHGAAHQPSFAAYVAPSYEPQAVAEPTDTYAGPPTDEPSTAPSQDYSGDPTDGSAPSQAPVTTDSYTWTVTEQLSDGSTAEATIDAGDPTQYQPGVENGSFDAGSGCTLNAGDDAVVPLSISITNQGDSDEYVGLQIDGVGQDTLPQLSGTSMSWEASYSDGSECDGQDEDTGSFGLKSDDQLSSGDDTSIDGFVDLAGFYSAGYSSDQIMSETTLTIDSEQPTNGDDATVTDVSGPGVVQNDDGSWSFTLAGQAP